MNRQPTDKDDLLAENMEEAFLQLMLKKYTMQEGEDLLELEKNTARMLPHRGSAEAVNTRPASLPWAPLSFG